MADVTEGVDKMALSSGHERPKETPEEKKARKEAEKKKKAEEKAMKEAKKAAQAAQRGQKAAVLTAPDPSDPLGAHYGDAEMVQSRARTDTKWHRLDELNKGLVGTTVRL
jgi:aspartyl-tRNA synthetase